jgi:HTH-type transcriptional regulator/antitoxin HigA
MRLEGSRPVGALDVLLALVELYEARRWPIEIDKTFDPVDVLSYAIDELGHTQAELAELLGSRSRASKVLSRRRALTVEMIHKVGEAWKIAVDLLVRPTKPSKPPDPYLRRSSEMASRSWIPNDRHGALRRSWRAAELVSLSFFRHVLITS